METTYALNVLFLVLKSFLKSLITINADKTVTSVSIIGVEIQTPRVPKIRGELIRPEYKVKIAEQLPTDLRTSLYPKLEKGLN